MLVCVENLVKVLRLDSCAGENRGCGVSDDDSLLALADTSSCSMDFVADLGDTIGDGGLCPSGI